MIFSSCSSLYVHVSLFSMLVFTECRQKNFYVRSKSRHMLSNYGASLLWMHIGIEQGMQALMKVMFEAMSGTFRPDLSRVCGDYNEFVCYVRDWTSVTRKSWSGFCPHMCKDSAKRSWTMGESLQMGHSTDDTSWYTIDDELRCFITNQPCCTGNRWSILLE